MDDHRRLAPGRSALNHGNDHSGCGRADLRRADRRHIGHRGRWLRRSRRAGQQRQRARSRADRQSGGAEFGLWRTAAGDCRTDAGCGQSGLVERHQGKQCTQRRRQTQRAGDDELQLFGIVRRGACSALDRVDRADLGGWKADPHRRRQFPFAGGDAVAQRQRRPDGRSADRRIRRCDPSSGLSRHCLCGVRGSAACRLWQSHPQSDLRDHCRWRCCRHRRRCHHGARNGWRAPAVGCVRCFPADHRAFFGAQRQPGRCHCSSC